MLLKDRRSGDRAGFVIAQADAAEQAVVVCENALQTAKITALKN